MRRAWVLALLAACATERADVAPPQETPTHTIPPPAPPPDDLSGEVREFVAKRWSEWVARHLEFPEQVTTSAAELQVEDEIPPGEYDDWQGGYRLLSATTNGETTEVVVVGCGNLWLLGYLARPWASDGRKAPRQRDWRTGEGIRIWRGAIPRADFERTLRKIALLRGALPSASPPPTEEGLTFRASPTFAVRLDGQAPLETRRSECYTGSYNDDVRALLVHSLVWSEAEHWNLSETRDDGSVGALLLRGLAADALSWRRPWRIAALGYLGCERAVPVLERLEPRGAVTDEALLRIRLLRECKDMRSAPPRLVELATTDDGSVRWWMRQWALDVLAERYRPEYRALLHARFEAGDREERWNVLGELWAYDPSDLTLARQASDDPNPYLRIRGAVLLGDTSLLLRMARDRWLAGQARAEAIRAATGTAPAGPDGPTKPLGHRAAVAAALRALLDDPEVCWAAIDGLVAMRDRDPGTGEALLRLARDPRGPFRTAACEALVALGFRDLLPPVIDAMLGEMLKALAERRGGDAADLACLLGTLDAREAIDPIDRALLRKCPSTFRYRVCFALAAMDDPRVMPILERERKKHLADPGALRNWDESIIIVISRQARKAGHDAAKELSDRFCTAELRDFRGDATFSEYWAVVDRAFEIRLAREMAPGPPVIPSR